MIITELLWHRFTMGRAAQLCPTRRIQWGHVQWGKSKDTHIYFMAYSIINIRSGISCYHTRAYNEKIFCYSPIQAYHPFLARSWLKISKQRENSCILSWNYTLTDFFSLCSQYFAFHQLVDLGDLAEPVMPDDWDRYFPDGVQNQYCMTLSQDQATNWEIWSLTTLQRKQITKQQQRQQYFVDKGWEHL